MKTFSANGPARISFEVGLGNVNVLARDCQSVTVTTEPREASHAPDVEAASRVTSELVDGVISVRTQKTWRRLTGPSQHDGAVVVEIVVPIGTSVSGRTGLGDVRLSGQLADCSVRSGMGDVHVDSVANAELTASFGDLTVNDCRADAKLKVSSGRLVAHNIQGAASIKNSNGSIQVGTLGGIASIRSSNGEVTVGVANESIDVKSACGDIEIGEVRSGDVVAHVGAGDLSIGVASGTAAWLDVTSAHGLVRSELEPGEPQETPDLTVRIKATTRYGAITIRRSGANAAA